MYFYRMSLSRQTTRFISLFLLFASSLFCFNQAALALHTLTPQNPPILFTADVSGGPFTIGDTIGLTLTLHNTTDYPLSSAQLDLPYQEHLLYQSGPGFKDAAAAEGTVLWG